MFFVHHILEHIVPNREGPKGIQLFALSERRMAELLLSAMDQVTEWSFREAEFVVA
jgi:hypothetical protein